MRASVCIAAALALTACGEEAGQPKNRNPEAAPAAGDTSALPLWTADQHTPGFFRNFYRIQLAQESLDDATAVGRLLGDLPDRIQAKDELPSLLPVTEQSIDALLITALRSIQANTEHMGRARQVSEALFERILQLDPARAAWNSSGNPRIEAHDGGPAFVAEAALEVLSLTARLSDVECQPLSMQHRAAWEPYGSELTWIPPRCEPDRFVGGYCEDDRYIPGECVSRWVEERCDGAGYESHGRYEYRCRSDGTCDYIWRPRIQYVPGSCTGGYYEEYCYSDRYEPGLCYEGTWVPGHCLEGRWESRAPGGTWSWPRYVTSASSTEGAALADCSWSAQRAVAEVALGVLTERLDEWLDPNWGVAATTALETGGAEDDQAVVDAAVQILEAVRDGALSRGQTP